MRALPSRFYCWLALVFGLLHMALHLYWYPRQACVHCCYHNRYCISLCSWSMRWPVTVLQSCWYDGSCWYELSLTRCGYKFADV